MEKLKAKQTVSNLTEAEAIKQAKEGDAAAFEFLYKMHCKRVYSLCLRMIKNPAEAEDLTQQTFLQLFRKIGTFQSGFSTWLHRVSVNIALMQPRRNKPAEIPAEDLERHSSNGEGAFEERFQRHFDARCDRQAEPHARDLQIAGRLQKPQDRRCGPARGLFFAAELLFVLSRAFRDSGSTI